MVPDEALFNVSNAEQCFDVMIIDDDANEGTENFMFTFDTPLDRESQNPQITLTPHLEVKITDNDEGKWILSYNKYYVG